VNIEVTRRTFLGSALVLVTDCSRAGPTARDKGGASGGVPAPVGDAAAVAPSRLSFTEKELEFPATPVGPERALALVPAWGAPDQRFPLLVALHGRGESVRGATVGARGWLDDYELGKTIERLRSPPLTRASFQEFVDDDRLARINASLVERPFRGLVVVCPWLPDLLAEKDRASLDAALPFGRFVVEQLLPRALAETPAQINPRAVGIDGVSLGGRAALVVGLAYPDQFASLGTLQAAIQDSEAKALARRARRALTDGGARPLRLLTSEQDYFRDAITQLHTALNAEGVPHEYLVVPGPHDYPFNRGPGGIEMLLWHDRVLRGEPPL
jgi:hypothetical protein